MSDFSKAAAPAVWSQDLRLHSYDVDFKHVASLETVCRFFLEVAWNHAEALGFGFTHLAEQNKVWVLSRLLVTIQKPPRWGEMVTARTWPRAAKSVFAMRDFELHDASGAGLAAGASAWLILDAATRKPQRADRFLSSICALSDRRAVFREPEKLPEQSCQGSGRKIVTNYSDIDVNRHVNSCRYIGMLLDSYDFEFYRSYKPATLEINYLGETLVGENLLAFTDQGEGGMFSHTIQRQESGQQVCRAQLKWATIGSEGLPGEG